MTQGSLEFGGVGYALKVEGHGYLTADFRFLPDCLGAMLWSTAEEAEESDHFAEYNSSAQIVRIRT
jgi:CxxC motif-containing protein (DUF1111 family)